ncbi:reprolysin-like metallopeptidase [Pseudomonas reactans]
MNCFHEMLTSVTSRVLSVIALALLFLSCCLLSNYATADQLFTFEPGVVQAGKSVRLTQILSEPSSAEVRFVKVKAVLISQSEKKISIPIAPDKTVSYKLYQFEPAKEGGVIWFGEIQTDRKKRFPSHDEVAVDSRNSAIFVGDGHRVTGTFQVEGQPYRLDSLPDGRHLLVKVDVSKLPPEGEPLLTQTSALSEAEQSPLEKANTVIDVLFVLTKKTEDFTGVDADNAIARANQANSSSGVNITFRWVNVLKTNYDETDNSVAVLSRILDPNDALLGGPVARRRDLRRADLVALIVSNTRNGVCGRAWMPADKAHAFSVTQRSCIDNETLTHEMGHNIGVDHNWDEGQPLKSPPYINGFRVPGRFSTVMSYGCSDAPCKRVNSWSTPNKQYTGLPMGTAQYHDAVRRLNERRATIANFYP